MLNFTILTQPPQKDNDEKEKQKILNKIYDNSKKKHRNKVDIPEIPHFSIFKTLAWVLKLEVILVNIFFGFILVSLFVDLPIFRHYSLDIKDVFEFLKYLIAQLIVTIIGALIGQFGTKK